MLNVYEDEEWCDILGFPNYIVSNFGRIFSIKSNRCLKPVRFNNGYLNVTLCNEFGRFIKSIHRLVAEAFLNNDLKDREVNHIDGDKTHNFVWNLEVCTSSENHKHAFDNGLISVDYLKKPIRCIETNEIFESITDAAKASGTYQSNISHVLSGRRRKANGFTFEYVG